MTEDLSCNCNTFYKRGIGIGVVIRDFIGTKDPLMVCALGDIHGEKDTYLKVDKKLEEARSNDSRILFVGDLIDNKINQSKSFYHGAESPHKEIDYLSDILKKYAPYIDGIVGGNHDLRTFKYAGEDPIRRLCLQYDIAYHPDALIIIYRIGRTIRATNEVRHDGGPVTYRIFMSHSMRGGRKEGGKLQKVVDYRNITNADIFISGHSHDMTTHKGGFIDISTNGTLKLKEQLFMNCGAFMPYSGYVVNHNFPPLPNGYVMMSLNNTKQDVKVVI